jgi:mRNA-degrading endonuclease RelE of RelBE toxin-antitoxin system
VRYEVRLSNRAAKDLDRLNRETQLRIVKRLEQIGEAPKDSRYSCALTGQGGLRRSRAGGWRIIFAVDDKGGKVNVVTIERRGQVYHRI